MRVDNQRFPGSFQKIQLNHYFCRSRDEIEQKLLRGRGDAGQAWQRNRFNAVDQSAPYIDKTVLSNLQQVLDQAFQKKPELMYSLTNTGLLTQMASLVQAINPSDLHIDIPTILVFSEAISKEQAIKANLLELQKRGDYQGLKNVYLELQHESPDQISIYTDLFNILIILREPDLAWQVLAQAWKLAPNSYAVLNSMAYYFLRVNNFEMAEKTIRLLLNIAPTDLQALGFLTEALLGMGRFEEALKVGIPVIELSVLVSELPEKMDTYLIKKMADYLITKNDYEGAIRLWQAGVRCRPQDVNALLEYSQVLLLAGNKADAQQQLTKAGVLAPQNETVLAMLKQVTVAPSVSKRRRH